MTYRCAAHTFDDKDEPYDGICDDCQHEAEMMCDCRRCGELTFLEDMCEPANGGTQWAGICLLCYWHETEVERVAQQWAANPMMFARSNGYDGGAA